MKLALDILKLIREFLVIVLLASVLTLGMGMMRALSQPMTPLPTSDPWVPATSEPTDWPQEWGTCVDTPTPGPCN